MWELEGDGETEIYELSEETLAASSESFEARENLGMAIGLGREFADSVSSTSSIATNNSSCIVCERGRGILSSIFKTFACFFFR
jgi:hypothetical protein